MGHDERTPAFTKRNLMEEARRDVRRETLLPALQPQRANLPSARLLILQLRMQVFLRPVERERHQHARLVPNLQELLREIFRVVQYSIPACLFQFSQLNNRHINQFHL